MGLILSSTCVLCDIPVQRLYQLSYEATSGWSRCGKICTLLQRSYITAKIVRCGEDVYFVPLLGTETLHLFQTAGASEFSWQELSAKITQFTSSNP